MSHNLEYLLTRPGILKLMTVVFGLVSAVLSGHSYGESPYTDHYEKELRLNNNTKRLPGTELEMYNMSATLIFLGVSFVYLAAHSLFYAICESRLNKFVDTAYHFVGALFLFTAGISVIYSAIHIDQKGCPDLELQREGQTPKYFSPLVAFFSLFQRKDSVVITSASRSHLFRDDPKFCHFMGEKIVTGIINIVNSLIYGFLGFVIFTTEVEEI